MFKSIIYFLAIEAGFSTFAFAADATWVVSDISGLGASCDATSLSKGTTFAGNCVLKTDAQTKIKVTNSSDVTLTVGADTQIRLQPDAPSQFKATVIQGFSRWLFNKPKDSKKSYSIRTANTVMGIRGTELLATYNPLLGESEVVCFEGAFDFTNSVNKKSKKISKNQWGGVGGRFGSFAEVLTLNPQTISHFDQISRF